MRVLSFRMGYVLRVVSCLPSYVRCLTYCLTCCVCLSVCMSLCLSVSLCIRTRVSVRTVASGSLAEGRRLRGSPERVREDPRLPPAFHEALGRPGVDSDKLRARRETERAEAARVRAGYLPSSGPGRPGKHLLRAPSRRAGGGKSWAHGSSGQPPGLEDQRADGPGGAHLQINVYLHTHIMYIIYIYIYIYIGRRSRGFWVSGPRADLQTKNRGF